MMKRVVWFTAGAVAGVGGSAYAKRKAREAANRYRPVSLAKGAVDRVTDAVREGRAAMAAREAELRAAQEADADAPEAVPVVLVETTAGEVVRPAPTDRHARSGPRRRSRR
jgi:hypothetical protein